MLLSTAFLTDGRQRVNNLVDCTCRASARSCRELHAPGIFTVGVGTSEDMAPELLGDGAGLSICALPLRGRALGAVAQEEQPSLLLCHVLLFVLHVLHLCLRAGVHAQVAACMQTCTLVTRPRASSAAVRQITPCHLMRHTCPHPW